MNFCPQDLQDLRCWMYSSSRCIVRVVLQSALWHAGHRGRLASTTGVSPGLLRGVLTDQSTSPETIAEYSIRGTQVFCSSTGCPATKSARASAQYFSPHGGTRQCVSRW